MKKYYLFCFLVCFWGEVLAQNYTAVSPRVRYRICKPGGSAQKVTEEAFVLLQISGKTKEKAVVFSTKCWVKINFEPEQNSLDAGLLKLQLHDSAELVLPYKMILEKLVSIPRTKKLAAKDEIVVNLRVLRIAENILLDDDYEQFEKMQERQEQQHIKRYLSEKGPFVKQGEIYKKVLHKGNNKKLEKFGESAVLNYTGRFLNGTKFDESPKDSPFVYVRGQQYQVIQGLAIAVGSMSEGEKSQFIIPAGLAFHKKGLADIVPPFTPVEYEVEVLKINKK